jgi:hypothetical protein
VTREVTQRERDLAQWEATQHDAAALAAVYRGGDEVLVTGGLVLAG